MTDSKFPALTDDAAKRRWIFVLGLTNAAQHWLSESII